MEAVNPYAIAHGYSPRAVTRAVQAGVRSIEHGNLIDEASARVMKAHGAYLAPTLATCLALAEEGERLGWSAAMLDQRAMVRARGIESLKIARAEGVSVAFGTDLLGHMHARQGIDCELRLGTKSAVEVLQSATIEAARLMRQQGAIGELVPGAWADLVVVDGDPTQDLSMLAGPKRGPLLVMKAGRIYRDTLQPA